MAEGNGDDEDPYSFRNYSLKKDGKPSEDGDDIDDSYLKPDLGIGNEPSFENNSENYVSGEQHANPANEHPKREENPFSFKHFLKRDPGSTGARPKVFGNHQSVNDLPPDPDGVPTPAPRHVVASEFTSVLPDFVQDHLVVEQCYLNHSDSTCGPPQLLGISLENLPDFAVNSPPDKSRSSRLWNERVGSVSEPSGDASLTFDPPGDLGLPFDLPLAGGGEVESGVSKSLPDFLSDGPIHGGRPGEGGEGEGDPDGDRVQQLRRELEATRRQLLDKTRRVQALERELLSIRSRDHDEMATLEKAIEQVEDNLKRSTRRAVTAESTVSKLKQEMKLLSKELTELRQENCSLRFCQAGAGASSSTPEERQAQRLAQDLRVAALTAEQSLRTLLTGVGNLRIIASTLDNLHRIQDRTGDYLGDRDDGSGPAL